MPNSKLISVFISSFFNDVCYQRDCRTLGILEKKVEDITTAELKVVNNKNTQIKHQIYKLTDSNHDLNDLVYFLENEMDDLNQYSRRENLELQNVPESVVQRDLEKFVLDVFKSIDVDVCSYDLVAVHRIGKISSRRGRNVIVRFVNRKKAYACRENSKRLITSSNILYKKIYITENLCPTYRNIFNRLYKLKKENIIRNVWCKDGHVFCKLCDERSTLTILTIILVKLIRLIELIYFSYNIMF